MRQLIGLMAAGLLAGSALAQCTADWLLEIGDPGVDTLSLRKGLAITDLGDGPEVLISGRFTGAGGVAANGNARWNPIDGWRTFGTSGLTTATGLILGSNVATTYRGDFFAGGGFVLADGTSVSNIARFEVSPEGDFWDPLNGGLNGQVLGMRVIEFEGEELLFVGGVFTAAASLGGGFDIPAAGIAAWDGNAWRGFGDGVIGAVNDFLLYDAGDGPELYIVGRFSVPGGRNGHIARWNGREFVEVGGGLTGGSNPRANIMTVYDFGEGDELVVGGNFFDAGGTAANCIVRWNGDRFATIGEGFNDTVTSLNIADVGDGSRLYAGGSFVSSGSEFVGGFASWEGDAWQSVGGGIAGGSVPGVAAIVEYDYPGLGSSLVLTGGFSFAGGDTARNIAIWACAGEACRVDLDGDGQLTIFDFLEFQNLFADGDLAADFDGDGVLTIFDFLVFQNEFAAGCD